jgi:pyridoxamine 5'-phosphate oxidase
MQKISLSQLRRQYSQGELDITSVHPDPIVQFGKWMDEVLASAIDEPAAMTLATADLSGKPSARMVLLKGFDDRGFVFFTNYDSRKGREINANPRVALVIYWKELERQVRIEGKVAKVSTIESDEYFTSRPPESRAGAIVSPQSQVISDRKSLEDRMKELLIMDEKDLVRPEHWGGFRVNPDTVEFWQGRPGRLHDRILYTRTKKGWKLQRLAP